METKTINILIDSGNCKNIGDNAMLVNVINTLAKETAWNFYVINKKTDFVFSKNIDRIKVIRNNNELLKMPNWRFNPDSDNLWLILFLFLFKIKKTFFLIDVLFYRAFKKHVISIAAINYWSEIINNTHGYWVVGGGNINDMGIGPVMCKMFFSKVFNIMHKPVIFSGQTIGPINRCISKLVVNDGVKYINLLSLREWESFKILKRNNKHLKNACVTADDALTLNTVEDSKETNIPKKFIALNFRASFYSIQKEELYKKYASVVKQLMDLYKNEHFVFIPIAFGKDDSDVISAKKISDLIGDNSDRLLVLKEGVSHNNIQAIIKNSILSIGISYHFCLFSISNGIPTIGIYGSEYYYLKLKGLMEMFGQCDNLVDLNKDSIKEMVKKTSSYYKNFSCSRVLSSKIHLEENWRKFFEKATNLINKYYV